MSLFYYGVFAPQNIYGFLSVIVLLLLLGMILYAGYRKFYEQRINRVLMGHRVKVWSLESVIILYFIFAVICTLLYMANVYAITVPEKDLQECQLLNNYTDFGGNQESVEEAVKKLHDKAKKSFIRQEQFDEDGLHTIYVEADKEYFLYAILYPLDHKPQLEERIVVAMETQSENGSGIASWYQRLDPTERELVVVQIGEYKENCPLPSYRLKLYNFTKGKNLHPFDIEKEFTIVKGGIETS